MGTRGVREDAMVGGEGESGSGVLVIEPMTSRRNLLSMASLEDVDERVCRGASKAGSTASCVVGVCGILDVVGDSSGVAEKGKFLYISRGDNDNKLPRALSTARDYPYIFHTSSFPSFSSLAISYYIIVIFLLFLCYYALHYYLLLFTLHTVITPHTLTAILY